MPHVGYLTKEEITFIHDLILRLTGGEKGTKHHGQLDSLSAEMSYAIGVDQKAAVLARGIIQGHLFNDGNKRTGHATMEAFLNRYGKVLTASDEATMAFTKNVAQGLLTMEQIINWISNHTRVIKNA